MEKIDTSTLPIKVEFVAKTKREDWECFEWRVTFSDTKKHSYWTVQFYSGLAHVTRPKNRFIESRPLKPSNDDILSALIIDASAADVNFHDWCSEYGYSDDSIKALNIYKACLETATGLLKYLGRDVIKQLAEQLQDL